MGMGTTEPGGQVFQPDRDLGSARGNACCLMGFYRALLELGGLLGDG